MSESTVNWTSPHTALRVGGWLPTDPGPIRSYVADLIAEVEAEGAIKLQPSVQALADLLEENGTLRLLANWMIRQVPAKYKHDPGGGPRIKDVPQMLRLVNKAIQLPPPYNDSGVVGFPLNAIFDWSMGTAAGSMFFLDRDVNEALRLILEDWRKNYLDDPASLSAFGPHDWGSPEAQKKIGIEQFKHTRDEPPWGFKTWNEFFAREFREGERPVADAADDRVIVSACESTPFAIQHGVNRKDRFWIKRQPYSLEELLDGSYVDDFERGTVYQAFLDALSYHRWHAPVRGKLIEARVVPGTYFAEAISEGLDPAGPNLSQGYIAHLATRAIFIFETKNLGRVAMIQVGMADCSSCQLKMKNNRGEDVEIDQERVKKGTCRVAKGDQVGYFLFGGSTYCLVFQEGVIESFEVDAIPRVEVMASKRKRWPLHVCSKLATAVYRNA